MTVLGNWWISAVLAVAMAAVASPRADAADPPTRPSSRPTEPGDYVQWLARSMEEGLPGARYDAAQRLVAISTPDARAAIAAALASSDDRTQVAASHAASEATVVDSSWMPRLIKLLARDRTTADYAARALAHFDNEAPAIQALIETARSKQPGQVPAIEAMGRVVQKSVAEALVGLVNDPAETSDVRDAAIKSLVHLSGQSARADNPATWNRWWAARSNATDDAWRSRVLAEQNGFLEQSDQHAAVRLAALRLHLYELLSRQYNDQPAGRKSDQLLGYLNDPDPDVRAAGAQIVPEAVNAAQQPKPDVKERLEYLVGDASPEVRLQVAQALAALFDANALDAIVLQLRIEPDIGVKKALIQTLARVDSKGSLPILQGLLNDPSESVAGAAADALKGIAPTLQGDPPRAQALFQVILQTINARTGPPGEPKSEPGTSDLRAKLIRCLGAAADRANAGEMVNLFRAFLASGESTVVRQAALASLGMIGEQAGPAGEQAGPAISDHLNPSAEPEPEVRREAALALGMIKSSAWARRLDESSRKQVEPSRVVQDAAWQSLQKVLQYVDAPNLIWWADQFKARQEFDRELFALMTACTKLADEPVSLAAERQTIGDIYTHDLNKPAEAIAYYQQALAYFENQKKPQPGLVTSLLKAYLAANQIGPAIEFCRDQLQRERANVQIIGPELANTAETLKDSDDPLKWAQARDLIMQSLGLDLEDQDKTRLQAILKEVRSPPATRAAQH
jgi:HEAT repeat protein